MFEKQIKNLKVFDIGLVKLAVALFVLFVLSLWPAAMGWVASVNPWNFLVFSVILALIVLFRMFK